ncbi:MAG: fucose isomerase [Deltaproteobacteria bacterium]|nr:fucose isomerase [Deltaproteobacteria bacterium]
MPKKIALFWPGDARQKPNELAMPGIVAATEQLERAFAKLGRATYRVGDVIAKPHEAIERLGPIDDPMVAVCTHWLYAPHTCDGVVGKDNPLLLASNFSGQWPGLVGLLNTGASLESLGRASSRAWTSAPDMSADAAFMERLDEWCTTGRIAYDESELHAAAPIDEGAIALARSVADEIRKRRVLLLMLGDTSMGMINGYFGPRLLTQHGFTEHKVDQAWIVDRGRRIEQKRIDDAFRFVCDRGLEFHWGEGPSSAGAGGAGDFDERASKEQLRDYLVALDLIEEFKADCVGWQYQLGLIPLRPPSDLAEGLLNSKCRPESNGAPIVCSTEADQGNALPMEMLKRLLKKKGLHEAVMFHDVRWGAEAPDPVRAARSDGSGRFLWVLLNSGSCGAYAFNHDPDSLRGAHSWRQPRLYFPTPGGSFAGESLPGAMTWARAYIKGGKLWMDVGKGEVVKLPPAVRDDWWSGTTPEWPFMAADMGISRDTLMAHYQSNHVAVAYGDVFAEMVALSRELGFEVRVLGRSL